MLAGCNQCLSLFLQHQYSVSVSTLSSARMEMQVGSYDNLSPFKRQSGTFLATLKAKWNQSVSGNKAALRYSRPDKAGKR